MCTYAVENEKAAAREVNHHTHLSRSSAIVREISAKVDWTVFSRFVNKALILVAHSTENCSVNASVIERDFGWDRFRFT